MKNTEKKTGTVTKVYKKIINGTETEITDTFIVKENITVSFSREYSVPITYVPEVGIHINEYTTKEKGKSVRIRETTEIDKNHKVKDYKKEYIR